jgi:hypothetical protein
MDPAAVHDDTDDGGGKLPPIVLDDSLCPTEQHFIVMGRSMKTLFVLALGQKELAGEGEPCVDLVDIDKPPWSLQKKKDVRPLLKDYITEIKRRAVLTGTPPKCNSWKAHVCLAWLIDNPITGDADKAFIRQQLNVFVTAVQAKAAEALTLKEGRWCGGIPYLRIIMSLMEDDIKIAFLNRDKAHTRLEIDGRKSVTRDKTVYELISDRWNSEMFNPVVPINPCHEDFLEATDCGYAVIAGLAPSTPLKVCDPASLVACIVLTHLFITD